MVKLMNDQKELRLELGLGGRLLGDGRPVFVIAEVGVNHNGDPGLARKLVRAAAAAGADAVKFQTFSAERLASRTARKAEYQRQTTGSDGSQLDLLKGLELSEAAHRDLKKEAEDCGLVFLSTPFDEASADFLLGLGVPGWKVSSGDVTNLPFLEHLGRTGLPVILSTGMSYLEEVSAAAAAVAASGGGAGVALLHCVSAYPAAAADLNLRALGVLRRLGVGPVGFSDHTLGVHLALGAVALGASVLEKHLTLDCGMKDPDHRASLEPEAFGRYVGGVREMELALGDGVKQPRGEEVGNRGVGRKSLHWARSLEPGGQVLEGDVVALRPATGLAPGCRAQVVGGRTMRAVVAGEPVLEGDVGR